MSSRDVASTYRGVNIKFQFFHFLYLTAKMFVFREKLQLSLDVFNPFDIAVGIFSYRATHDRNVLKEITVKYFK